VSKVADNALAIVCALTGSRGRVSGASDRQPRRRTVAVHQLRRIWRDKVRGAARIERLNVDPHAPGQFRANGSLRSQDRFVDAFGVKPDDAMYPPSGAFCSGRPSARWFVTTRTGSRPPTGMNFPGISIAWKRPGSPPKWPSCLLRSAASVIRWEPRMRAAAAVIWAGRMICRKARNRTLSERGTGFPERIMLL